MRPTKCTHENLEYERGYPATLEEPGELEGWYCLDCESWLDEDDWPERPDYHYDEEPDYGDQV